MLTAISSATSRRRVRAAPVVGLLLVALGLTGCSGDGGSAGTTARESATRSADRIVPDSSSTSVTARSATSAPLPTLPPGDPGDGPSVPEDTSGVEEPPGAALTGIPRSALLDAETVEAVVGGSWRAAKAPADSCDAPRPPGPVATRTGALTGAAGLLVETVATHPSEGRAAQAVDAVADRLTGCGWTEQEEPPLGEDSALLTRTTARGSERLTIVAAEGVSVTVLLRGPIADAADDWAALVDVAIGTSCLAASDGCH